MVFKAPDCFCSVIWRHNNTTYVWPKCLETDEEPVVESKEPVVWTAPPWVSVRSFDSVFMSVLIGAAGYKKGKKIMLKRWLNAPLIRLWMRAARCSSSFMHCWFHRGINTMLSQHPAQPHQPRCTASTADYLILCLLTHLSLPATEASIVGRGISGDVTHPLPATTGSPLLHSEPRCPNSVQVGIKASDGEDSKGCVKVSWIDCTYLNLQTNPTPSSPHSQLIIMEHLWFNNKN